MGAWGIGVFENDLACDFAEKVGESDSFDVLEQVFDRVLESAENYLEASDAEAGLAGAELVARVKGACGIQSVYPASLDAWLERLKGAPSDELVTKARGTIARVLRQPSELLELWRQCSDFEEWKRSIIELSERLHAITVDNNGGSLEFSRQRGEPVQHRGRGDAHL